MRDDVVIPHKKKHVELELFGGDEISDVVRRAVALSAWEECSVGVEFNGIQIFVDAKDEVASAIDDYYTQLKDAGA